jgi:hypothetical protein
VRGGVSSQQRANTWSRVTSVQTSTFDASIGDCVQVNTTSAGVIVNLPAIVAGNKGGRILITATPVSNANGFTTLPHGTDTVVGQPAASNPGFATPNFSVVLVSDGVSNWLGEALI